MNEELVCVRCKSSAEDSGVPRLCSKCARKMERLSRKLGYGVRVQYMDNWKLDRILRKVRRECLRILEACLEVEREKEKYE